MRAEWTCHLALRNLAAALVGGGVGRVAWCHPGGGRDVCVIEVQWQAICSGGEE